MDERNDGLNDLDTLLLLLLQCVECIESENDTKKKKINNLNDIHFSCTKRKGICMVESLSFVLDGCVSVNWDAFIK